MSFKQLLEKATSHIESESFDEAFKLLNEIFKLCQQQNSKDKLAKNKQTSDSLKFILNALWNHYSEKGEKASKKVFSYDQNPIKFYNSVLKISEYLIILSQISPQSFSKEELSYELKWGHAGEESSKQSTFEEIAEKRKNNR